MKQGLFNKANRPAFLLILGLFLLWNWRLANITALNHEHIIHAEFLSLFAWKTVFFFGLCLSLYMALRNVRRTLLGVAAFVAFWLLGGALVKAAWVGAPLDIIMYLILISAVVFIVSYAINNHLELFGTIVSVFSLVVVGMQLPGLYTALTAQTTKVSLNGFESDLPAQTNGSLPHIVYIVPDRYASNANLKSLYNYSNEAFTSKLRTIGFHVWDDQNANYPKTFVSLPSTLNADYLDLALKHVPENITSRDYVTPLIQDFAARRALQASGYTYTHIGGWWGPTEFNPLADHNYNDVTIPFDQFTRAYLQSTPLVFALAHAESKMTPCEVIEDKAAFIHRQVQSQSPQFVLWHSLVTHDPYVYAEDGSCRGRDEERKFVGDYPARSANYIAHIEHFNRISSDLIDKVLRDASRDVIIVIQSDEGPFPEALLRQTNKPYNFLTAPQQEKRRKHGVFNAIYLPSQDYEDAQNLKSPVNNFRLIFRELTGQPIRFLEDRSYSFEVSTDPYDMRDVTQELLSTE